MTFRKLESTQRLADASARIRLLDEIEMQDVDRAMRLILKWMEDVGLDPDSGEFDADIIETGTSKSQRETVKWIEEYISEKQHKGDETDIMMDELMQAAVEADFDTDRVEHELQKLIDKGDAYYPGEDRVAIP